MMPNRGVKCNAWRWGWVCTLIIFGILTLPCFGKEKTYWSLFSKTESLEDLPFDVPTDEEIRRGLLVPPPHFWGNEIRKDRSLRLVLIGGSNTGIYGARLRYLISMKVNASELNPNSYVQSEARAATDVSGHLYRKFDFEDKYPIELWPNIVCLELSINGRAGWGKVKDADRLIFILNRLWAKQGLKQPSYMFIDLFTVGQYYSPDWSGITHYPIGGPGNTYWASPSAATREAVVSVEVAKLNPHPEGKGMDNIERMWSRGAQSGNYLFALARFYGIPFVSLADAMFPSFTRYFVQSVAPNDTHGNQMWPFNDDGMHVNALSRLVLVDKLLISLLETELQRNSSRNQDRVSIYDYDIRLFSPNTYMSADVLGSHTSWGQSQNTLAKVVVSNPAWTFMSTRNHETDGMHICYGSQQTSASTVPSPAQITLRFEDKNCLPQSPCGLDLSYVHSWNRSYIGGAVCDLFLTSHPDLRPFGGGRQDYVRVTPPGGHSIQGDVVNGQPVVDTTVHTHKISRNVTSRGVYLLECGAEGHGQVLVKQYKNTRHHQPALPSSSSSSPPQQEHHRSELLSCIAGVTLISAASAT